MLYVWSWMQTITAGLRRDEGATMVEYGLMVAVIALVVVGAATALGFALDGLFNNAADKVGEAPVAPSP